MPEIIAFTGDRRAGKDTCCDRVSAILAPHGVSTVKMGFSDPLYESVAALFGVSVEFLHEHKDNDWMGVEVHDEDEGTKFFTFRDMLERMGTEVGRDTFGSGFWVDQLMQRAFHHENGDDIVVIRDLRFPNEAEAVLASGGLILAVEGATPEQQSDGHASRAGLAKGYASEVIRNVRHDDNYASLDAQLAEALTRSGLSELLDFDLGPVS